MGIPIYAWFIFLLYFELHGMVCYSLPRMLFALPDYYKGNANVLYYIHYNMNVLRMNATKKDPPHSLGVGDYLGWRKIKLGLFGGVPGADPIIWYEIVSLFPIGKEACSASRELYGWGSSLFSQLRKPQTIIMITTINNKCKKVINIVVLSK